MSVSSSLQSEQSPHPVVRLHPREGLENQKIEGHPWLGESGLWFVPVRHESNRNASAEEVECIAGLVVGLLPSGVNWTDDKGGSRPLRLDDVVIVAPYNAQVSDLSKRIPHALVGTVDKFQGQQAPVVIYSLTTSSPEDALRGMEFLYSLNRLNFATSRAQAVVIVCRQPSSSGTRVPQSTANAVGERALPLC